METLTRFKGLGVRRDKVGLHRPYPKARTEGVSRRGAIGT